MAVLRNRYFLISLAALLLSACSIGPDYVRPNIEVPEKWRIESSAQAASADSSWWEQLGDAELNSLVQAALSNVSMLSMVPRALSSSRKQISKARRLVADSQ
jgi:outer membrane protein TolC